MSDNNIIGLWINQIPDKILNNNGHLRELSKIIIQDYPAEEMFVAESSLLITMKVPLPANIIKSVAASLKKFLTRMELSRRDVDLVTVSTYDDLGKWEEKKRELTGKDGQGGASNPSNNIDDWNVDDTAAWLESIGLQSHCQAFKENEIRGLDLKELTAADFKELGMSIGQRKKLKRELDRLDTLQAAPPRRIENLPIEDSVPVSPTEPEVSEERKHELQDLKTYGQLWNEQDPVGGTDGTISKAKVLRLLKRSKMPVSSNQIWNMATKSEPDPTKCRFSSFVSMMKLLSFVQRGMNPNVLNLERLKTSHPALPEFTALTSYSDEPEETGAGGSQQSGKVLHVTGIPQWLLDDNDYLFDFEKLVFQGYRLSEFDVRDIGLIVLCDDPIEKSELDNLRKKFQRVMSNLQIDEKSWSNLTIDFFNENNPGVPTGAGVGPGVDMSAEEPRSPPSINDGGGATEIPRDDDSVSLPDGLVDYDMPVDPDQPPSESSLPVEAERHNYLTKLESIFDLEDVFEAEDDKITNGTGKMMLSQIRSVLPKSIKRDDPGLKEIVGLTRRELEEKLSACTAETIEKITGKPFATATEVQEGPTVDGLLRDTQLAEYVGMSVDGLPRFITDSDEMVAGIESSVFPEKMVSRITVLDTIDPPGLRIEFSSAINSNRIPQLARRLKNFLKAVKVSQQNLNDVTIAFLDLQSWNESEVDLNNPEPNADPTNPVVPEPRKPRHHKTNSEKEPLVKPDKPLELATSCILEGLPSDKLDSDSFLEAMEATVFKNFVLSAMAPTESNLEVMFAQPINIQHLPKVAMRLKKFLKKQQIPPEVVNGVTLQIRHEEPDVQPDNPAVVGLIFKGIPQSILNDDRALYGMEDHVFTSDHPIRLMEPVEDESLIRITLGTPIYNQVEVHRLAQRLKKFLASQSVSQTLINDVLVMSFAPDKWPDDKPQPSMFSPMDYVGIEIENMPVEIVESDVQLEMIEQHVFTKQKVVHMNIIDTTLRITFGVPTDSKAIEKVARELKRFLSQMSVPIAKINDIIIAPHTTETWEMPVPGNNHEDLAIDFPVPPQDEQNLKRMTVESWQSYLRQFTLEIYTRMNTLDVENARQVLGKLRKCDPLTIQNRGDPGLKYLVGKSFAEVENVMKHTTVLIARALFGYASRPPSQRGSISDRAGAVRGAGNRLTQDALDRLRQKR